MEGRRPLPEIQALVAKPSTTQPRRIMNGVESGRIAMVLAVLEQRCGLRLNDRDVYVLDCRRGQGERPGSRPGGCARDRLSGMRQASAATHRRAGRVGLAGELRRVPGTDRRLSEAARLGSAEAVIPAELRDSGEQIMTVHAGMLVHSVTTVEQALATLGLSRD